MEQTPAILRLSVLAIAIIVGISSVTGVTPTNDIKCGTVNLYRPVIIGGQEALRDEWPFIAALYYSKTFTYFCGGTVISNKHILTAAHCIQAKGSGVPLSSDDITVRLGAYNLTDRREKDVVDRNVTEIHIHPGWNINKDKYYADIAILVLNENITFSKHIRPVCMPPADFSTDGLNGTVVGWGKTENGTAEGIPRKIEINALNDEHCYETVTGIASSAPERSFCGAGSGIPNYGDSGGGFFAVAGSGWVQFGIVSFVRSEAAQSVRKVAVYMKLTFSRDWIAEKVQQSGSKISLATTTVDLNCTYRYTEAYGCWLFNLNVRQENFEVANFTGSHDADKNNEDVELIVFKTGVMDSLPRNFGNIFKNLKFLLISVDTRIQFLNCSTAVVGENSLWHIPNLQSFELKNSKMELLDATIFSRNFKLTLVHVLSSALKALPRNLFLNNSLLEHVYFDDNAIETIDENIFETNANLRVVSLQGNCLRHLSRNLFRNNSELLTIDLSDNLIKTMDEQAFIMNSKILSLSLESNALEFAPGQLLGGMTFLEEFRMQKNVLRVIDEQLFENNVRIKKIDLRSNRLTHIPANLFHSNVRLQVVHLGTNAIEAMDEKLFESNSVLQNVFLESNRLVEFPANLFKHNPLLELVNFRGNLLERIDEHSFEWNVRLREINFEDNYVTVLPGKLFQNNSLLEIVRFDANSLEAIDEHIFHTNVNLQAVYLSSNLLDHLPENLFHNNPLLQIVDLSNNLFTTLAQNIFSKNANLEKVSLQGGILQSVPRNLFQANSRLQYIDLSENMLTFIATDFTVLKRAKFISLSENVCADTVVGDAHKISNETMTTFQFRVMSTCSEDHSRSAIILESWQYNILSFFQLLLQKNSNVANVQNETVSK